MEAGCSEGPRPTATSTSKRPFLPSGTSLWWRAPRRTRRAGVTAWPCASWARILRKSALWRLGLTQRRTLRFPGPTDCTFPLRCGVRKVWGNRPPDCGALWKMAQLGKCARATARQPAGRVAPGSAKIGLEFDLTQRRSLTAAPHVKAQSGHTPSTLPRSTALDSGLAASDERGWRASCRRIPAWRFSSTASASL